MKNSWIHALIIAMLTVLVGFTIILILIFTDLKRSKYEYFTIPLFIGLPIITFSIGVLIKKYNSYKQSFLVGLKSSLFTGLIGLAAILIGFYFKGHLYTYNSIPLYKYLTIFITFFIPFACISLIIPVFGKKHWNKLDNQINDNDLLDN